jgi:hypothetical protein
VFVVNHAMPGKAKDLRLIGFPQRDKEHLAAAHRVRVYATMHSSAPVGNHIRTVVRRANRADRIKMRGGDRGDVSDFRPSDLDDRRRVFCLPD